MKHIQTKLVAKVTVGHPFCCDEVAPRNHWIGSYMDSRVNLAWCLRVEHIIVPVDRMIRALYQLLDLF